MRRSFSRTSNGPGALVPSPKSVAATVRLLLPPVALGRITDAKSLRGRGTSGLPPSHSPRRRSGEVDSYRATAAPARDSTDSASNHRLRFVMNEKLTCRIQRKQQPHDWTQNRLLSYPHPDVSPLTSLKYQRPSL